MKHALRLYVTSGSPLSSRATANLSMLCELHLAGSYELEVLDILEHPDLAEADNILAAPTLIRRTPSPQCKIVGDLGDPELVLRALNLSPKPGTEETER